MEACGGSSCNEEGQAPVEVETLLLEVDRGALGGIDSEAAAEFQLADRLQGLVDAAGCVGSCFVARAAVSSTLPLFVRTSSRSGVAASGVEEPHSVRLATADEDLHSVSDAHLFAGADSLATRGYEGVFE